jgi:hypothetical protein
MVQKSAETGGIILITEAEAGDSLIEPLLGVQKLKKQVMFGDTLIDKHPSFRLYLISRDPSP